MYKCLFEGRMFGDIPWNVWRHSPEYNIPPIPLVPRIPFPVPVLLVLYIAFDMFSRSIQTEIKYVKKSSKNNRKIYG